MQLFGQENSTLRGRLAIDTSRRGATRKTFSVTYLVLATSDETENDVLEFGKLPTLYRPYRNAYCVSKQATEVTEVANGFLWRVRCGFDSHIDRDIPVVDVSWSVEEEMRIQQYDRVSGELLTNSAGQLMDLETPISIPVLTLKRVEPIFSASRILYYNNSVNAGTFFGAPSYCARMVGPRAVKKIIDGIRMWEVTYTVKFDMTIHPRTLQSQGWRGTFLDHGSFRLNDDGEKEAAEDEVNRQPQLINLDGTGHALPDGAPPVFISYNKFTVRNFAALGLED